MNHFGSALGACVLCACIPQAFPPLSTMPRKNRKKTSTSKAGPAGARSQAVPVLTLLALASDGRHSEIARLVNGGGIDNINEADERGWTALLVGCQTGHSEVVQLLVSAGASVDQADNDGATPLFMACQNGHSEVALMLLSTGASVDQAMNDGATPLMTAAHKGRSAIVRYLLKHGADPSLTWSEDRSTALHLAAMQGHKKCVALLAPHASPEQLANTTSLVPAEMRDKLRLRQCAYCGKLQVLGEKTFKKCGQCRVLRYCSKDCQTKHWEGKHELECKAEASSSDEEEEEKAVAVVQSTVRFALTRLCPNAPWSPVLPVALAGQGLRGVQAHAHQHRHGAQELRAVPRGALLLARAPAAGLAPPQADVQRQDSQGRRRGAGWGRQVKPEVMR